MTPSAAYELLLSDLSRRIESAMRKPEAPLDEPEERDVEREYEIECAAADQDFDR